jgi:hypothetical protein
LPVVQIQLQVLSAEWPVTTAGSSTEQYRLTVVRIQPVK